MKYRFAVELSLPLIRDGSQESFQEVLNLALERGFASLGHSSNTAEVKVEKMRARSVDLDKSVEGNLE